MSSTPKHQKVTEYTPQEDGTTKIHAKSYYEDLTHEKVEIEKHTEAYKDTLLRDFLSCLDLVTKENSPEVTICIRYARKHYEDTWNITKRWTVQKNDFGRR